MSCCSFSAKDKKGRDIKVGDHIYNVKDCHCGEVICENDCIKIRFQGGAVEDFAAYHKLHGQHIILTKTKCYDRKCEERCQDKTC